VLDLFTRTSKRDHRAVEAMGRSRDKWLSRLPVTRASTKLEPESTRVQRDIRLAKSAVTTTSLAHFRRLWDGGIDYVNCVAGRALYPRSAAWFRQPDFHFRLTIRADYTRRRGGAVQVESAAEVRLEASKSNGGATQLHSGRIPETICGESACPRCDLGAIDLHFPACQQHAIRQKR
jgi:hypothetical protein